MSKFQRFQNIVIGLSMLISAAILILLPEGGCLYIMLFLAASLILRGGTDLLLHHGKIHGGREADPVHRRRIF